MDIKQPNETSNPLTPEEDSLYEAAMLDLRGAIAAGYSLPDAWSRLTWLDEEMRDLVRDDFIKIVIGEQHFGQDKSFATVAGMLGIPVEEVTFMHGVMLDEVREELANQYRKGLAKVTH